MPVTLGFSVLANAVFLMFAFDLSISDKALVTHLYVCILVEDYIYIYQGDCF